MDPITFLIGNGIVVTIVALTFLRLRRGRAPSRLKLTSGRPKNPLNNPVVKEQAPPVIPEVTETKNLDEERTLNIFFNYNGHTWDAYEVLAVPAGSSREAIENAYQVALSKVDAESRTFIEYAYKAIYTSLKWS
jgi:hypothetical protein